MNAPQRIGTSRTAGFSLIELMVGLVIGMIAIIVVMQVFKLSEGSKRTTTGGDDAQISGVIALNTLQRDIRQAGHGVSAFALIGCDVALRAGVTLRAIAPVTINPVNAAGVPTIPVGDTNTDTLLIVYGNSAGSVEGDPVRAQLVTTQYTVNTASSFVVGDHIIAEPASRPSPCELTLEKLTAAPVEPNVVVPTGVTGMVNGTLFNLGTEPQILAYAVRDGALTVCDYMVNDCSKLNDLSVNPPVVRWLPIGDNIVSLRATYGRDQTGAMDAVVDIYDQTKPTSECEWARVSAIRLALAARSAQVEKEAVSTVMSPDWAASAVAPINLSNNRTWAQHRYRVFETTVPLRNMAWQGVHAGC